jgi:predicted deacylase
VPLWEPIATGVAIITGVMVVVGCAPAEDRIPYLLATAGDEHSRASDSQRRQRETSSAGRFTLAAPVLNWAAPTAAVLVKIEAGQKVAIQRNSFGEVVAEYTGSVAGEVTGQRSEAMSEPGNKPRSALYDPARQNVAEHPRAT